jgi:dolichol-phosphate mannosyltransferase
LGWARRAIISFSYAPLDLIGWLAFFTTAAAVLAGLAEIVLKIVNPDAAPQGFTTLIVVVLFIGGVQMICFSVIGSYLAHMYEEIKARPPYIVERVLNPPEGRAISEQASSELAHADVRVVATGDEATVAPDR